MQAEGQVYAASFPLQLQRGKKKKKTNFKLK